MKKAWLVFTCLLLCMMTTIPVCARAGGGGSSGSGAVSYTHLTQNLQDLLTQNNERILQAMRSIRNRSAQEIKEQNEKEEDLQSD